MLVSPVDPNSDAADPRCAEFRPVPSLALPFPSLLVNAIDDGRSAALARLWGSRRADASRHPEAARGPWPEGLRLLASLAVANMHRPEPVPA